MDTENVSGWVIAIVAIAALVADAGPACAARQAHEPLSRCAGLGCTIEVIA